MSKIIYLFIFFILTTNTSCLKKQNLDEEDLGPAFDPTELSQAMSAGYGSLDYSLLKPNEYSSYVLTQKIQDSSFNTLEQQDITIISLDNTAASLSLDLNVTKIFYNNGQTSQKIRKWHEVFSKTEGQQTALNISSKISPLADVEEPEYLFIYFQIIAFGYCYNKGYSCHQLQVSDINYRVPMAAASQHGCADPENCTVKARKIEFDSINSLKIDKDGKPKRTHFTLIVSKEVPFLSRLLQYCSRSLYEISSSQQKILADICYNINDYAFGN